MPNVGGKKFPYTKQGMKDAEEAKDKMGYKEGGDVKKNKRVTSKDKLSAKAKKDEIKKMLTANNTSEAKDKTPAQAATPMPTTGSAKPMGADLMTPQGAPKKPPMMKKGGKVKKGGSCGGYKKGGKVRGAGIAKKGVRKCKMR
jgi:hypothetical protein